MQPDKRLYEWSGLMSSAKFRLLMALMTLLVLAVTACSLTAAPVSTTAPTKPIDGSGTATEEVARSTSGQTMQVSKPEKTGLKIGLSVDATSFLPVYLAAQRTFQEEGLNVEIVSFRGDAEVAQALAADSVDITVASLNGLINMLNAGQPVKGFYAGFYQADFEWLAKPDVKTWADMKGRRIGISTYGALTDFLTRYALRKHGLESERDVQIMQVGGSPQAAEALRAGRLDAAILSPPFKWRLASEGFTVLGTQAKEVGEAWPKHIFFAKERFIEQNPNTVLAVLRAHVKAIRIAKTDRSAAVAVMADRLKYEWQDAERAYDDVINGFNERGELPTVWMPVFWEIAIAAGDVKEAWPEVRFLDRRFIDTFDQWAPK